jgi:cytochrome d ubiquinol oxidase subunit II
MGLAVLGGADFGAGVWEFVARGRTADAQRAALIRAIGPIWEANEIWLIFAITGVWTGFPLVFYAVMTVLFVPLTLGLLGIVMRGASFSFYTHIRLATQFSSIWGRIFSAVSVITPYLFGTIAAAVVSGEIRVDANDNAHANLITTWNTPFAIACGLFAVALCAVLAATYMTVEANRQHDHQLTLIFRKRALIAGAISALIGTAAAWLASFWATYFFNGLTTRALPLALAAVVVGVLTALMLLLGLYFLARMLVAGMVILIFGAWAVAQLPYLIVPDVTIARGAAPDGVVVAVIIAAIVTAVLVLPSLWYMMRLFKSKQGGQHEMTTEEFIHQIAGEEDERTAMAHAAALEGASRGLSRLSSARQNR